MRLWLPSGEILGDFFPFAAVPAMCVEQHFVFLLGPDLVVDVWVEVIVPS
jgi:hypothetical protein